ncbi:MAG: hypothetical protein CBB68_03300 [Rhodospirillaceae bacterium TMED8]|nr:peptidase M23 [Magnetovibrio sp.]OUT51916.1 MAG: hypothetical protein CBB68_03300 [Rhodospirillaceae bacterium TMED8]|tara:strand:- start:2693 stop:3736 length:1044 start_codon:yes stop_codon:yes gene_type:complete
MGSLIRLAFRPIALALWLSACGYAEWPPRDGVVRDIKSSKIGTDLRKLDAQDPRNKNIVIAGKGDTVYGLSRRHKVSIQSIIQVNSLLAPFHLQVGQRVHLLRDAEHKVASGDTLFAIASRYKMGMHALARMNGIKSPYEIVIGQKLRLPSENFNASLTSSSLSFDSGLKLKNKEKRRGSPSRPISSSVKPRVAANKITPTEASNRKPKDAELISKLPKRSGEGFLWPIKGRILSNFGAKPKGFRNDGINIAATKGAGIQAAQNGIVVYAGNELRGFGNLLLIKHRGGYVTAYAHADRLLVKRGDRVEKGERIATVGDTGSVTRPQLHFEIRKGRRARNPKNYLRRV